MSFWRSLIRSTVGKLVPVLTGLLTRKSTVAQAEEQATAVLVDVLTAAVNHGVDKVVAPDEKPKDE